MDDVLSFEASKLLDLSVFSAFNVSVQDAIRTLRSKQEDTEQDIAALRERVQYLDSFRTKVATFILQKNTDTPMVKSCFDAWNRFAIKKTKRKQKHLRVVPLEMKHTTSLLRVYYQRLVLFRKVAERRTRRMRSVMLNTMTAMLQKAFRKWTDFLYSKVNRRNARLNRLPVVTSELDGKNRTKLISRYYTKFVLFERVAKKRRHKVTISHALLVQNGKVLCQGHFERWKQWAALIRSWKQKRRLRGDRLRQLAGKTRQTVLSKFFHKFVRFAELLHREREREDTIARLAELTLRSDANATESLLELKMDFDAKMGDVFAKCDLIGSQVDVSLTSLSNTNNVLNKMVDRLLGVDEHLDLLHKEKVSRTEMDVLSRGGNPNNGVGITADPRNPESVRLSPRRRHTTSSPNPQSRQVSPNRLRDDAGMTKQRTTFAGFGGVINAVSSGGGGGGGGGAAGGATLPGASPGAATKELDSILRRLEHRQKNIGLGGGAAGGPPLQPPGPPPDVSQKAQKELDSLRVRELEKKLGIPQHYTVPTN